MINLAQILQELIIADGISISELSRRVGIPQPTLQRIFSGKHSNPHKKTLVTLSNYFGTNLLNSPSNNKNASNIIKKIPLITFDNIGKSFNHRGTQQIAVDNEISDESFALKMPDQSMEPLIQKNGILIVDTKRKAQYKSLVLIKLDDTPIYLVRQLICDAYNLFIKPLSSDFDNSSIIKLVSWEQILGVIVEVRCHYY